MPLPDIRIWLTVSFLFLAGGARAAEPGRRPQVWQRWEHTLTSTRGYDNPYADVTLRVSYVGPDGRTLRAYGFWDGGNVFRIRCAFPVAGTWRWETECSDAANTGLHQQRGTAEVLPYRGDNALYRHGFLKVSENRRYLVYDDGTPFLWLGDTAWAGPMRARDEEWAAYRAARTAQHFTLLQVAPASEWAGPSDRHGERPFTDKACSQWNPAYWRSFEQKVQHANEAGLVVLLAGLMEPVQRYPEADKACLFARNIVSRLYGNFAIFSPSFDREFMPLANEVGRAAREATTVHLITQHPGTPWNQPQDVTRRMVLAKTAAGDPAVAYLPNNDAVEIDVSAFPAPLKGRWFDPVQGRYAPSADRIENKGTRRFAPPAQGDWVLLFEKVEE
jgi:hypothetical protein